MELVIGNKNYSSWSLRGWLMLQAFEVPFEETRLPLFTEEFKDGMAARGLSGQVPVLLDDEFKVWDSLAICEYINERYLEGAGWPEALAARAEARSIVSQMHAGFPALRSELTLNCRRQLRVNLSEAAQAEIAVIDEMWSGLRERYAADGEWLFGRFTIADVFYAPVALRFESYGIALSPQSEAYKALVLAHPAIQAWVAAAHEETEVLACFEFEDITQVDD